MKLLCWWFGCHPRPHSFYGARYEICWRCGEEVPYSDLVGDTRHNRAKQWANYWLFRKWFPERCRACGRRWKCNESISHEDADIPF